MPANGNAVARIDGDTLWGLGATDMKAGLAVMVALAREVRDPAVEVTYVFYAGEEVASVHNGLGHLFRDRPDLLAADVALLGSPPMRRSRPDARAPCAPR
ncbi:MAG: M20/M25/M40 family metallo-hydrolase [Acidimicrobiales bacterium]